MRPLSRQELAQYRAKKPELIDRADVLALCDQVENLADLLDRERRAGQQEAEQATASKAAVEAHRLELIAQEARSRTSVAEAHADAARWRVRAEEAMRLIDEVQTAWKRTGVELSHTYAKLDQERDHRVATERSLQAQQALVKSLDVERARLRTAVEATLDAWLKAEPILSRHFAGRRGAADVSARDQIDQLTVALNNPSKEIP